MLRWQFALLLLAGGLIVVSADDQSADTLRESMCHTNLLLIHDAVRHYTNEHRGEVPYTLSELVPSYLADLSILSCPQALAMGVTSVGITGRSGISDPKTTYFYEFNSGRAMGLGEVSNRELKLKQMEFVGNEVPLARCLMHGPNYLKPSRALNLSYSGKIYTSGLEWERLFTNLPPAAALFLVPTQSSAKTGK